MPGVAGVRAENQPGPELSPNRLAWIKTFGHWYLDEDAWDVG